MIHAAHVVYIRANETDAGTTPMVAATMHEHADTEGASADDHDSPAAAGAAHAAPARWSRWERWVVAALFGLYALIVCQGVNEDFIVGHQGWGGSMRSTIGRNYDEVGFTATGLKPIKNWETVTDLEKARVHWNHPPAINLLVGASFRAFGESNAAARLVPILCALALFWLVYAYTRRRYGPREACAVVFVLSLLPMHMEYGNMLNYEPLVLMLGALAVKLLERLRDPHHGWSTARWGGALALLCLTLMAAGFSDWPGFIVAFAIGIDAIARKPRQFEIFLAVGVTSALFMAWCAWWLTADSDPELLLKLGKSRSGANITLARLFMRVFDRALDYYLLLPLMLATSWIVARARSHREIDPLVSVFTLTALIYALAFRQGTWVHVFYISYITPAVALAAGVGAARFTTRLDTPRARNLALAFLAALLMTTVWRQADATHDRSYQIMEPKKPSRGFPRDGRVNQIALGKWIRANTQGDERYLIERRLKPTMGMRYYAARAYRNVRRAPKTPRAGDALYVTTVKLSKLGQRKALARRFPVTIFGDYLIYDLRRGGEVDVEAIKLAPSPMTLWHAYTTSVIYPPYDVVEDPARALKSRGAWGLEEAPREPK